MCFRRLKNRALTYYFLVGFAVETLRDVAVPLAAAVPLAVAGFPAEESVCAVALAELDAGLSPSPLVSPVVNPIHFRTVGDTSDSIRRPHAIPMTVESRTTVTAFEDRIDIKDTTNKSHLYLVINRKG